MDRPNLQGRVPDTITTRLPGGGPDGTGDATDGSSEDDSIPDADGSDSRRLTTVLTLSGLGLAALGVVFRYVLERRGGGETDDAAHRDEPDRDRDFEGSVQVVGDTGAIDVADDAASAAGTDERGTTADAADTEAEAGGGVETFEPDRAADEDDDGAAIDGERDAEREGPPRIAPLVGLVGLVGMRLFVERVRKRYAERPDETAGQL